MVINPWPIFQDIVGATTTPKANPYYGAQLLTPDDHPSIKQPLWVDATGQPITDASHIAQLQNTPQLANEPWVEPGFFSRLGTTGSEENLANMAALQYAGQQAQTLAAQERQSRGMYGTETGNLIGRMNAFSQLPNNVLGAGAYLGIGNGANLNAFNDTAARQAQGTPSAEATAATAIAQHNAATVPAVANPDISSTAATQAQIAKNLAPLIGQNQTWQTMYSDPATMARQQFDATHMGVGGTALNMLTIDPITGAVISQPNPLRTPMLDFMGRAINPQGGDGLANAYGLAPKTLGVPPNNGLIGQPQQQSVNQPQQPAPWVAPPKEDVGPPKEWTPIHGTDYYFDQNDNVFYKNGTFIPPEYYKDVPLGKVINHAIGLKKAVEIHQKESLLPHGIGNILGNTWSGTMHSLYDPYNVWQKTGNLIEHSISGE